MPDCVGRPALQAAEDAAVVCDGAATCERPEQSQASVRKQIFRRGLKVCALLAAFTFVYANSVLYRAIRPVEPRQYFHLAPQVLLAPQKGFKNSRITILCIGEDENLQTNGVVGGVHFGNADTILLVSLDLSRRTASCLSIPRDEYAHIAGTKLSTKVNYAFAHGGIDCASATISEFMGIKPDYHVVVSIGELRALIDALGGIDVKVESAMQYDDISGHLHIDLKPGEQHLNGNDALAYIRYRKTVRNGMVVQTPESGDKKRIVRQQVAIRAILRKVKCARSVLHCNSLFDTCLGSVHTDLTRSQVLDLIAMYCRIDPSEVVCDQLPGNRYRAPDGGDDLFVTSKVREEYRAMLIHKPSL